jgi:predicted DNA-binding transcriptional regulator AlpA
MDDGSANVEESRPSWQLLSLRELSLMLCCHPRSIHRWWREGKMPPPLRIGNGALRWNPATISRWLEEKEAEGHEGTRPGPRKHRKSV